MNNKKDFTDYLKVEGILFKGFGTIPKFIMLDNDLSLEAKAIYSYFASFAGSGDSAFPSVQKIRNDLQISESTYYTHYKQLIDEGYIKTEQSRYRNSEGKVRLGNNIYTLVANPKKFEEKKNLNNNKSSRIKLKGMKSLGYGTIPKAVMLDQRLTIKAKAIYSYFASFAGSGDSAFPKLDNVLYHLNISKSTYYKHFNKLIENNYITVEQRNVEGRFSVNDYYLNETPGISLVEILPSTKIQGTEENVDIKPFLPSTKIQGTEKPSTEKQGAFNINSSLNINSIYYNQSINQQKLDMKEMERMNIKDIKEIIKKEMQEEKTLPYRYTQSNRIMGEAIKLLTEYERRNEWYKENKHKLKNIDELRHSTFKLFNEALSEMLTTKSMKLKGSHVTYAKIYDKLVEGIEINDRYMYIGDIMENAIEDFQKASTEGEIYNPVKYMQSVIWNALQIGNIRLETSLHRDWGF